MQFLLSVACLHCAAQGLKIDSLKKALPRQKQDTLRVKILDELSIAYRYVKPDSAIAFARNALTLAEKISYKKGVAVSLNFVGTAFFFKGDYPKAQELQKKALAYSQLHHLDVQEANILNSLALAYQNQGDYYQALNSYLDALEIDEKIKDTFGRVKVLSNIGLLWKAQEHYDNAIKYYKLGLALSDSVKDSRSLKIVKASAFNNLGIVFTEQKKYAEALDYYSKSLSLNIQLGSKLYAANCKCNIGFCYLRMGQLIEAEKYLLEALNQLVSFQSNSIFALSKNNLAEVYLLQHKPHQALNLLKESLELSTKYGKKDVKLMNYENLASAYKELGQPVMAYNYLAKAYQLADSLKNSDLSKRITDLQNSYELKKKESEIVLLEKNTAIKNSELRGEKFFRYSLIAASSGLCMFFGFVYYSFSNKVSLNKKLQKQKEEILRSQALRAQMNPHFIFNSLNSIQLLIVDLESEKASSYLSEFSMLLRMVMDNSEKDFISVAEEIQILQLYLKLESLRFDSSFDYEIESRIPDIDSVKIPPMIVQPFVENALQHGLMPKQGDRKLEIVFSQCSDSIVCEIRDNGIGRVKAEEISRKNRKTFDSKGMRFTSERLLLTNKILNGKSSVNISDLEEGEQATGTLVKITFAYA